MKNCLMCKNTEILTFNFSQGAIFLYMKTLIAIGKSDIYILVLNNNVTDSKPMLNLYHILSFEGAFIK